MDTSYVFPNQTDTVSGRIYSTLVLSGSSMNVGDGEIWAMVVLSHTPIDSGLKPLQVDCGEVHSRRPPVSNSPPKSPTDSSTPAAMASANP